jgi:fumarate hydratase subunit alpha
VLDAIKQGVVEGLRALPGRPMGIMGDDSRRIDQSGGLNPDSAGVEPSPILIRKTDENVIRLHIMMFGGGPAIRAKTYRVFHKHNTQVVIDEIVNWAKEGVSLLGCSPCTLAVGVGRSHFEATSMMLLALVDGDFNVQNEMEEEITRRVNEADIGPLGLHGNTSVLATFMKVGPQRASGVRIVCVRPCCCFEPRIASVEL